MGQPLDEMTLLTVRVTRGELRTIANNARARGLNMTEWVRQLLTAQGVDLEPQPAAQDGGRVGDAEVVQLDILARGDMEAAVAVLRCEGGDGAHGVEHARIADAEFADPIDHAIADTR
jgi:hypothetical protein